MIYYCYKQKQKLNKEDLDEQIIKERQPNGILID